MCAISQGRHVGGTVPYSWIPHWKWTWWIPHYIAIYYKNACLLRKNKKAHGLPGQPMTANRTWPPTNSGMQRTFVDCPGMSSRDSRWLGRPSFICINQLWIRLHQPCHWRQCFHAGDIDWLLERSIMLIGSIELIKQKNENAILKWTEKSFQPQWFNVAYLRTWPGRDMISGKKTWVLGCETCFFSPHSAKMSALFRVETYHGYEGAKACTAQVHGISSHFGDGCLRASLKRAWVLRLWEIVSRCPKCEINRKASVNNIISGLASVPRLLAIRGKQG